MMRAYRYFDTSTSRGHTEIGDCPFPFCPVIEVHTAADFHQLSFYLQLTLHAIIRS